MARQATRNTCIVANGFLAAVTPADSVSVADEPRTARRQSRIQRLGRDGCRPPPPSRKVARELLVNMQGP